jgi:cell division protein FtsA
VSVAPRIQKVFAAVNIGSFRISAMVIGLDERGDPLVLGSSHRASAGIRRGFVTDARAASHAVRDAVERAERSAGTSVAGVWLGCSGAGLESEVAKVETAIGGRRIERDDLDHLLGAAREHTEPIGRTVLHARPTRYTLDGAHGVADPTGLHAESLEVDVHLIYAQGSPIRNLVEIVQMAHLDVEGVIASPLAASYACLSEEERDLGIALVELGSEVTNVSVHSQAMVAGIRSIDHGGSRITDAVASAFGLRRSQAERLKCVSGSALASPADHKEMIELPPDERGPSGAGARDGASERRIPRADLVSVITDELAALTKQVAKALEELGAAGRGGGQVVLTGGGAELAGIADYAQAALGRPVRIGRPTPLRGLPEAHSGPGFATLAGLCLFALDDPLDIRSIVESQQPVTGYSPGMIVTRLLRAAREYF